MPVQARMPQESSNQGLVVPQGMAVLLHRGMYFLVPKGITPADLDDPLVRANPRIQSARNLDELLTHAATSLPERQIEFVGWLPQFEDFGNCGKHPQFLASLRTPPEGWAFVQNPPLRAFRPEVIWDTDFWRLLARLDHLYGLPAILQGRPDTILLTESYRGSSYNVFLHRREYFGIPADVPPGIELRHDPGVLRDSAVVRASDLPGVLAAIEQKVTGHDFGPNPSRAAYVFRGYCGLDISIVQYRNAYLVWPNRSGQCSIWSVHREMSLELEHRLDLEVRLPEPLPEWKWKAAMAGLALRSLANGARWSAILHFVTSREPNVNRRFRTPARASFVTSVPYVITPTPWVIEIEDSTSLFVPYARNGTTGAMHIRDLPAFPVVKSLLEQRHCRAVLTHIRSTAESLRTLFRSRTIDRKIVYCPLGFVPEQPISLRTVKGPNEPVHVLFSSSWHQNQVGFFVRGGVDLLEAFDRVAARDSRLHLTVRCAIPGGWCKDRFGELQAKYGRDRVRNLSAYLPPEEWRGLLLSSDIFALPAARIHVVSLLEAMAHGVTVLTSDGWAIEEYVTDRETGLLVTGRAGEVSWVDKATGMLREDYSSLYTPNETMVARLASALEELANDAGLRWNLAVQAQEAVRTRFTLERWNATLNEVFEAI